MAEIVADCPRCGAKKVTFLVKHARGYATENQWKHHFEMYSLCRSCGKGTILAAKQREYQDRGFFQEHKDKLHALSIGLTKLMEVVGYVSLKDRVATPPPEYLPDDVRRIFEEGARCAAVSCPNAAGAMFRLCIDIATSPLLPPEDTGGLNPRTRRDLGLRLPWLFDNGRLPQGLRELATCIREDGNDAAHRGNLTQEDAADLLDFARLLLERLYTEPARLEEAAKRRAERKAAASSS